MEEVQDSKVSMGTGTGVRVKPGGEPEGCIQASLCGGGEGMKQAHRLLQMLE